MNQKGSIREIIIIIINIIIMCFKKILRKNINCVHLLSMYKPGNQNFMTCCKLT